MITIYYKDEIIYTGKYENASIVLNTNNKHCESDFKIVITK